MAFVCALTGEVPEEPVISLISKNVFERRILEKFVLTNGRDPVTDEPMTMEDVIAIRSADIIAPQLTSHTSIPSLLKTLQDEWDAFVLQNYSRSKQFHSLKKELSISLFQLDSSCRIIARLLKENAELKKMLSNMNPIEDAQKSMELDVGESVANQSEEVNGIDPPIFEKILSLSVELTSSRKTKNKNLPPDVATPQEIGAFKVTYENTNLHSASTAGILSLDMRLSDSYLVTGGNDKCGVVFDLKNDQVVTTLKGHTKKVTHVVFHPLEPFVATGSADTQVRIWDETRPRAQKIIKTHSSPITGLSFHPLGSYILSTAADQSWVLSDINLGTSLASQSLSTHQFTCCQIHPDGLIFGTGTNLGPVLIWDFKSCNNVATFEGHTDAVVAVAYSENGYHLASAAADGAVRLWDLRKTKCVHVMQLEPENNSFTSLAFDETGQYLSVGGRDIQIFACKKWEKLCCLSEQTSVTALKFGPKAQSLVSVGLDRALRIYSQ